MPARRRHLPGPGSLHEAAVHALAIMIADAGVVHVAAHLDISRQQVRRNLDAATLDAWTGVQLKLLTTIEREELGTCQFSLALAAYYDPRQNDPQGSDFALEAAAARSLAEMQRTILDAPDLGPNPETRAYYEALLVALTSATTATTHLLGRVKTAMRDRKRPVPRCAGMLLLIGCLLGGAATTDQQARTPRNTRARREQLVHLVARSA